LLSSRRTQVMAQYPNEFAFTPLLLAEIADIVHSCRFGDFLFNSERSALPAPGSVVRPNGTVPTQRATQRPYRLAHDVSVDVPAAVASCSPLRRPAPCACLRPRAARSHEQLYANPNFAPTGQPLVRARAEASPAIPGPTAWAPRDSWSCARTCRR
jgi:hypothetical protein